MKTPNECAAEVATDLIEGLDKLLAQVNVEGLPFGAHGAMWFALSSANNAIRDARKLADAGEWTGPLTTR